MPNETHPTITPDGPKPCLSCGYDLTGLPESGPCPECGSPAVISVLGTPLYLLPARRLGRIRLGARIIAAGALGLPVLWAFAIFQQDWHLRVSMRYHIMSATLMLGVIAIGSFPITASLRPAARYFRRFDIAHIIARLTAVALVASTIAMIASDPYDNRTESRWGLIIGLMALVHCFVVLSHIHQIGILTPKRRLARDALAALIFLPLTAFGSLPLASGVGLVGLTLPLMLLACLCMMLSRQISNHLRTRQQETARRGIAIDAFATPAPPTLR